MIYKLSLYIQLHVVVVDVKLVENRNCEKSSEKAMTKLERLYSSRDAGMFTGSYDQLTTN